MLDNEKIIEVTDKLLRYKICKKYCGATKPPTGHPILERLFPHEKKIFSAVHGLQGSLGKFWEDLANELAYENGFEVIKITDGERGVWKPNPCPPELEELINTTVKDRVDSDGELDFTDFRNKLNLLTDQNNDTIGIGKGKMLSGMGIDLLLKKEGSTYIFDIKTVHVNQGNGLKFNQNLVHWLAYYKYLNPGINAFQIEPRFAFPYSPADEDHDESWWGMFKGRIRPIRREDIHIGNEFWKFLTGNEHALGSMIKAFDSISDDTEFTEFFRNGLFRSDSNHQDELDKFRFDTKFKWIEWQKKITVEDREDSSLKKLRWSHNNNNNNESCQFEARIAKLINYDQFECPECGMLLGTEFPFKYVK